MKQLSQSDFQNIVPINLNASTSAKGIIQLAGDLGGTAASPTVNTATFAASGKTKQTFYNVRDYGALGDGVTDDTTAIQSALTAANAGGCVVFPKGNYVTSGIVVQNMSNFTIRGDRGSNVWIAQSTAGSPFVGTRNIFTIADCTDFIIEGFTIDGRRDTIAPLLPVTTNITAGQAFVKVANGTASAYCVGMRLNVLGGLTANAGTEKDTSTLNLVVQSITAGTAGADDTITFSTAIPIAYTAGSGTLSDGYGPFAAPGVYVTPWQTGENYTVAGRILSEEDQQQGIHLINCKRFTISRMEIRGMWESPIRCGTHLLNGTAQNDGCSYGIITGNTLYHCYDQGVGLWCSRAITVSNNSISAAGWAGICLTVADDCTITGNIVNDNSQRIPGDTKSGSGIAIEGGRGNVISANKISNNNGPGVYLTAGGTLPFGSAAQVATTVTSNNLSLPAATIGLTTTAGLATAGQITILSSAGAQQVTYTGVTGNNLTGCTGGTGTLFAGYAVAQYPLFLQNATPGNVFEIGSTTLTVSDGTKFQVGGHYTIVDGPKTERIDVTAIATNTLTLASATTFRHADKCQIGQAVCEGNLIVGNSIVGTNDAGVRLSSAVRTNISNNVIDRAGLRGIDLGIWTAGGLQPPFGTVVAANTITAPDATGDGANYQAIYAERFSDLTVNNNRCGGALSTQGYYVALHLQAMTASTVSGNQVSDSFGVGLRIDNHDDWVSKRLKVEGNQILRTLNEGVILYGGDGLIFSGNVITGCAPNNGPGGYGGALDIRGVQNSEIINNIVNNNGHGGIGLDTATINSVTVYCLNNIISRNVVRDDGKNVDAATGVISQQGTGVKELSVGQGPNTFEGNVVSGNITNWSLTSTGNTALNNVPASPYDTVSITRTIITVTTTVTGAATAATDYVYLLGAGAVYTQPTAVGNSNVYTLKNIHTTNKTVAFTSAQTADGSTSLTLTPNTSLDLISDGANWRII